MRTLASFALLVSLLASCRNDNLEEMHPQTPATPAATDPRDHYTGNYQFTATYHNVTYVMGGSDTTFTAQYNGYVNKSDTNLYVIRYGLYDSVVVTTSATDASHFFVNTASGIASGSFTVSGQDTLVDLSYVRSQSPSHTFSATFHGQKQ